eukprot:3911093-Prorocentrum_lima.AAC.1
MAADPAAVEGQAAAAATDPATTVNVSVTTDGKKSFPSTPRWAPHRWAMFQPPTKARVARKP